MPKNATNVGKSLKANKEKGDVYRCLPFLQINKGIKMPEYRVIIKATISIDDPDTLSKLILCRMTENEVSPVLLDDDFEVIEYPDDWLDFTEIIKQKA